MDNTIILIRHGEAYSNIDPVFYGFPDAVNILTAQGLNQSIILMEKMKGLIDVDLYFNTVAISSELQRAKLTAQIAQSDLEPIIYSYSDARLNEVTFALGVRTETDRQVKDRVASLLASYPNKCLILFCHGLLMEILDPNLPHPKNTEIRKYDREIFEQVYLA